MLRGNVFFERGSRPPKSVMRDAATVVERDGLRESSEIQYTSG